MSIRLRLALWYGALFGLVLLVVLLLTYALHARGHYDDLDRALVSTAGHIGTVASAGAALAVDEASGGLEVAIRLYGPDGDLQHASPSATTPPTVDPREVLASPGGPAFDVVAGLAPAIGEEQAPPGAFGLITAGARRWRVYVLPIGGEVGPISYIEVLAPLASIDASIQTFRVVPLGLGVAGLAAALLGGWAIAGGVLQPVATMTATAGSIARTRDFAHRIIVPPHPDELHQLAETFNAMLASLEMAYRAQQQFVADASHELRAPLTAIQGNLDLVRRFPAMPASEREAALKEAGREAERLTHLVADLLILARADAGTPLRRQPVELDRVVLEALAAARHLARGQTITLAHLDPVMVRGDPDRLKQVVLILTDNALKYTPPEGRVTLALRRDGVSAVVTVSDTGMGIAPDEVARVFERFYRADPARARDPGGTGLGLPIARWIVEQHGGDVSLTSHPGMGTTATIRLPAAG